MCLIIPKQVIAVDKDKVKVSLLRSSTPLKELSSFANDIETVSSIIPVKKGDWVLTQNIVRHGSPQDVIIKKIKAKEAKEILKIVNNHKL